MALTDLSGIGSKTAEKLKSKGISTERQLAEAQRRNDPVLDEFGSRVNQAAQDLAVDRFGGYVDTELGVEVTPENRSAIETFTERKTSDLNDSGSINRRNNLADEPLLELGRRAVSGAGLAESLGVPTRDEVEDFTVQDTDDRERKERMQNKRRFGEMGFDVAANLANVGRETIREANELRQETESPGKKGENTAFTRTKTRESFDGSTSEYETDVRVEPREYAAAQRIHNARPPMAKRVDSRRQAETVTGNFEEWKENPGQVDYPNVDTAKKGSQAGRTFDDTQREQEVEVTFLPTGGGFRLEEYSESDDPREGRTERLAGEILSAPQEQQRLVLNDLLPGEQEVDELGLQPRGPDEKLFFGDPEGAFR